MKAAEAGKSFGAGAKSVTPEQTKPSMLRAENARLKMHVEILINSPRGVAPSRWLETPGCLR